VLLAGSLVQDLCRTDNPIGESVPVHCARLRQRDRPAISQEPLLRSKRRALHERRPDVASADLRNMYVEKQLYSSHYFETALDLTFCIRENVSSKQPGFYLIMAMGSEQAGLTGFKGSIVRKVAVDRLASSLQKSLTTIKTALEREQ
jgi:hypothetical protein